MPFDIGHTDTVQLDPEQQDKLMDLRAQQDRILQQRFEKFVVVMFTDVVGSTAYYEKYGDLLGRQKMLTHNALLFPIVRESDGTVIKTLGDSIMACFPEVDGAMTAAVAMQRALDLFNGACANPE